MTWRWLIGVSLALVFLVTGYFTLKFVYPAAKAWRAHELTKQAEELFSSNQPGAAEAKLIAAYNLAPFNLDVLRACAHDELMAKKPSSLEFYRRLLHLPGATRDDQRDALRAYFAFDNLQAAAELAQALMAKSPEAEDYALQAQVDWATRQVSPAIALMRKALALDEKNREIQFMLAEWLTLTGNNDNQTEALRMLQGLAQTQDLQGLRALELMAMSPGLDDASRRSLLDQLKQHPLLDDEGRFSAWDLESHLNDRDSKVVLQQVVEFFKTADLQRKSKAAQWLNNHGQSELALELAKPPDSSANQELLLARLDALANLKNWAEVEKELSVTGIPLPQSLIYLYTARSAQELGDLPRSQTAWEKARSAAVTEPGMLVYLGEYALKLGAYDEAGKTFSVMSRQSPEQALKYYTLLVQTEARSGQNTQLMQTLKQMTVDLPYEPEPKNDWAYLNLLLNTNVDEASKVAEALVKAHPQILAYRSTLALAYLRKNDPADAAKVYQGLQIDWSSAPASWKLIYAVVLAANGDKAKAQGFISGITRDQVRPEESALMNAYLGLH